MKRIFLVLLFCAMTLSGCGKNELLNEMSGVWRASDKTLLTFSHADGKLLFAINNDALNAELGAVDTKNRTVSIVVNIPAAGKQTWTVRSETDKDTKAPHLVFTLHDGTQDTLSFVRKITPVDLEKFARTEVPQPAKPVAQVASEAESREQPPVVQEQSDTVEQEGVCAGLDLAVTTEQLECLGRKYDIADKELNGVYKRLMATLDDTRKATLKKEQQAWIKQKESTCRQAGKEVAGGTMETVMINDCYVQETEKRVAYLKGIN